MQSVKTTSAAPPRRLLAQLDIDGRLLFMVLAIAGIWTAFHLLTGGIFMTSRNLWNLSVQTASVGVMVSGMVLIIVMRNIDLSIGSVLGFTGMAMAVLNIRVITQDNWGGRCSRWRLGWRWAWASACFRARGWHCWACRPLSSRWAAY